MPIVRSVGEHADLMLWLAEAGGDGIKALHISAQQHQQRLYDSYVEEQGAAPEGVTRQPDLYAPATTSEAEAVSGLGSVEQRAGSFEGVPYYVYRALSNLVHAGLSTSRVYSPVDDQGTGQLLNTPSQGALHDWPKAALADCAVRCCEAALVFSREVRSLQLSEQVEAWCSSLGLSTQLPARITRSAQPPSWEVVRQAASNARTDVSAVNPILERLAAVPPASGDAAFVLRVVRQVGKASRALSRWAESQDA